VTVFPFCLQLYTRRHAEGTLTLTLHHVASV